MMKNEDTIALNLGQGFSIAHGKTRQRGVYGTVEDGGGGKSEVNITVCKNVYAFKSLVELSLSRNIDAEDVLAYQDRVNLVNEVDVTETCVCIVVASNIELPVRHYVNARLNGGEKQEEAIRTLSDVNAFCMHYGDSFVSSITRGAQYYAIYKYECNTLDSKNKLLWEMAAAGIVDQTVASADYSANFELKLKKIRSKNRFTVSVIGCAWAIPQDATVIDTAFAFQSIDQGSIYGIIDFSTEGYEHVFKTASAQQLFSNVKENRQLLTGDDIEPGIILRGNKILETRKQLRSIEAFYAYYGQSIDSTSATNAKQIDSDVAQYATVLDGFDDNPTKLITAPSFPSDAYGVPYRACQECYSHAYGGSGGNVFDDCSEMSFLHDQWRISSISARGDAWLNWLEVQYINSKGGTKTFTHGAPGGNDPICVDLSLQNSVTGMTVSDRPGDWYQNYLLIQTTENPAGVSVGASPDQSHQLSIFQQSKCGRMILAGMRGSAGLYINMLGANWVQFSDLVWRVTP